jgi:hypothetical protein
LTKYSIEKDGEVNNLSKKDVVRGRHRVCLSYPARWQEQLHWSNIPAVLHISWNLTDEYCYQPERLKRIMGMQRKNVDLVAPLRKLKRLMRCAESIILLVPPSMVGNMASEILIRCKVESTPVHINNLLRAKYHPLLNLWAARCPLWHSVQDCLKGN